MRVEILAVLNYTFAPYITYTTYLKLGHKYIYRYSGKFNISVRYVGTYAKNLVYVDLHVYCIKSVSKTRES